MHIPLHKTIKTVAALHLLTLATASFGQENATVTAVGGATPTTRLAPFSLAAPGGAPGALPPPWRVVGLPGNKVPLARPEIATVDGVPVLRLATDRSYGSAVHELPRVTLAADARLAWRWRLDQPLAAANLRTKEGDDAALKVCALFDLPLDRLSFGERNLMRLARLVSGEPLPSATLCYVWDNTLPAGTVLPNAFSGRVVYWVLNGAESPPGAWARHDRPLAADFRKAFALDGPMPPLTAIAVGADADNTGGHSLGHVGDVTLRP